jgi:serine/threonine protein kinase
VTKKDMSESQTYAYGDRPGGGQLIKGRYKIQQELGRGGMGVVYLAHDTELHNRPVVIKVLRDATAEDWLTKKFRQEIEALVRIEHPGVVGIFDAGEMPDGQLFVVMQFVEGVNLRSILTKEGKQVDFEQTARIVEQVGRALTAAHERGVLHCDLKPENIMLQTSQPGEEIVKLIDFGIAKIRDSKVTSAEPTKIAGTMEYMAPEQLSGSPTTASDIFSLGIIAYEMLTGRKPFPANNLLQLFEAHKTGVKEPPKILRPDLPEPAQAAILRALNPDPEQRYKRARDFGDDLRAALLTPARYAPTEAFTKSQNTTGSVQRKRSYTVTIIANVVLLVVALAVAWWAFRSPAKQQATGFVAPPRSPAGNPVPAPILPELKMNYHMMMQKTGNSKAFRIAKELLFEKGNRVQLFVNAPEAGCLYMVNEGPGGYVVLFPSTLNNNGSARIAANQEIQIPGKGSFVFDAEEGTEKLWIFFSRKEIPDLEDIKSVATPEKKGELKDPLMIQNLAGFIMNHPADQTESKRDLDANQTVLTARGDALVYLMLLEHH